MAGWRSSLPAVVAADLDALSPAGTALAVHFWAEWNGADPQMDRSIRAIEEQFAGRVRFVACDIDQAANVDLYRRFGVVNVPTLAVVVAGRRPRLVVGLCEPDRLATAVEAALGPEPQAWWRFWRRRKAEPVTVPNQSRRVGSP